MTTIETAVYAIKKLQERELGPAVRVAELELRLIDQLQSGENDPHETDWAIITEPGDVARQYNVLSRHSGITFDDFENTHLKGRLVDTALSMGWKVADTVEGAVRLESPDQEWLYAANVADDRVLVHFDGWDQ